MLKKYVMILAFFLMSSVRCSIVEDVAHFLEMHSNALVLFYRPGCPYCKYVLPLFDAVQKKYAGQENIVFLKVDISAEKDHLKEAFNFNTVPTFIYVKDGLEKLRHGSYDKRLTQKNIEDNLLRIYA